MGLLDCVASPEGRDEFDENRRPIARPKELSRSDHDISRRRALPLFASQTSLKNVRDVDFWRKKVLRFLFAPEGREDIRELRVPLKPLGYVTVTDFISEIPVDLFKEYENQTPDEGIFKDDKIFWVRDGIAEPGIFKWQGVIDDVPCIGVQLDRKKAVPFGVHDGKGLFYCKPGHRALVPGQEVTPYKKFLRRYLGLPPKKDSLLGSIRYSAKALAARNSKPGDRVYLPKEKKWATVIWIGKIEDETVVDLVYEPVKPPAGGKPLSPDEPCISRSMSLADFIGELESEPNSPMGPMTPITPVVTPVTPMTPVTPVTPVNPISIQTITATVESHAIPSSPTKTETPPVSPQPNEESDGEEDLSDETNSEDDDETESEDEDDDTASESERSISDESVHEMPVDEGNLVTTPLTPPPVIKSYQGMENISTEILTTSADDSAKLPSPKRKGFFGFPQKQNKKAKARSPLPIRKAEPAKDLSVFIESDHIPPQPPPRKSKSAGNLFANWKFAMPTKKPKKEALEEANKEAPPITPRFQKQKPKSDWGGMFKVRSKGSLPKLSFDDSHPSKDPPECQTPIDEMLPPDKIPTPPPDKFNERQIERPNDLPIVPASPSPTTDPNSDRSSVQSPLYVPPPPPPSTSIPEKRKENDSVNEKSADVLTPDENDDETDDSDASETDDEMSPQQVDTKVEMHVAPPVPSTAVPESDFSEEEPLEFSEVRKLSIQYAETRKSSQVDSPENTNIQSPTTKELQSPVRVQSPTYLEKFKEAKIRTRPSSFGSFLARIKNQPKKPDTSLQPSVTLLTPTFREEREEIQEQDASITQPPLQNDMDTSTPATQRPSSPSVSSVELNENPTPNEGSMQITRTLVKPPKPTLRKMDSQGNQEEIILGPLDVEEDSPEVKSPLPAEPEKTPKHKAGKGRTFSFVFSRKRKPSSGATLEKELQSTQKASDEPINNNENIDPNVQEVKKEKEQVQEESEKERKQSITSSFRNSFRRTFSLTRKKQSSIDLDDEPPMSPPSNITKPRPVSLYIDNNEVVTKKKNSFRSKRPASVHVDIQPWDSRRGREGVDVYSSPSSEEAPASPLKSPTNRALTPKQLDDDIPKHRIFTTPAFFHRKSQKADIDKTPLIPKSSNAPQKKRSSSEEEEQPLSPTRSDKVIRTPSFENPPSRPTSPPPPLPTAPPPIKGVKRQPSIVAVEKKAPVNLESSPSTKLKSALKQRKEIDSIPKGLKIGDRVLWYSGKGPVPGTVQKLFKDGTDKYTAGVKFDREVTDEPLRLVREGDAYMITVEELITPDMFGSSGPANDTPAEVITVVPPTPQTPGTPSVRFDGLNAAAGDGVDNDAVEESDEDDEDHDLPPPFQEEEVSMACGFRRGIQCQDKSCCLETILFSLFYTTNAFDISILYGNTRDEDSVTRNTRKILRKDIVDPLRRNGFCDSKAVKKLRDAVKPLSDEWQTLSTDAEVMMFILFDRALKLGKFISYSNDMSDFLHQLVVDAKDLSKSTTVQHLFEASLHLMDKIKLKTVPTPALILEMPRSNDKLMQYHAIIPNLSLHVSHLMDKGTRLCICGMVAKFECTHCSATAGKISIVYCDNCKDTADVIHFQLTHEAQLSPLNQPVVILDLVAIICVKGGHYFSFVKCGNNSVSPWVYFDGTELDNPKVCIEQNLGMWLDRLEKYPGRYQDALQYPLLTQILQDSHICIYQPREKSSSV